MSTLHIFFCVFLLLRYIAWVLRLNAMPMTHDEHTTVIICCNLCWTRNTTKIDSHCHWHYTLFMSIRFFLNVSHASFNIHFTFEIGELNTVNSQLFDNFTRIAEGTIAVYRFDLRCKYSRYWTYAFVVFNGSFFLIIVRIYQQFEHLIPLIFSILSTQFTSANTLKHITWTPNNIFNTDEKVFEYKWH